MKSLSNVINSSTSIEDIACIKCIESAPDKPFAIETIKTEFMNSVKFIAYEICRLGNLSNSITNSCAFSGFEFLEINPPISLKPKIEITPVNSPLFNFSFEFYGHFVVWVIRKIRPYENTGINIFHSTSPFFFLLGRIQLPCP